MPRHEVDVADNYTRFPKTTDRVSVTNPVFESEDVTGANVAEKTLRIIEIPVPHVSPKFSEFFIPVALRTGGLLTNHGPI